MNTENESFLLNSNNTSTSEKITFEKDWTIIVSKSEYVLYSRDVVNFLLRSSFPHSSPAATTMVPLEMRVNFQPLHLFQKMTSEEKSQIEIRVVPSVFNSNYISFINSCLSYAFGTTTTFAMNWKDLQAATHLDSDFVNKEQNKLIELSDNWNENAPGDYDPLALLATLQVLIYITSNTLHLQKTTRGNKSSSTFCRILLAIVYGNFSNLEHFSIASREVLFEHSCNILKRLCFAQVKVKIP